MIGAFGTLWEPFRGSWEPFEGSWERFEGSWEPFEGSWEPFGGFKFREPFGGFKFRDLEVLDLWLRSCHDKVDTLAPKRLYRDYFKAKVSM